MAVIIGDSVLDETLTGTGAADQIYGDTQGGYTQAQGDFGLSHDRLLGRAGNDQLFGDAGEFLAGEFFAEGTFGSLRGGDDTLLGGPGSDMLFGDAGWNLSAVGNSSGSTSSATGGDDTLRGEGGDDFLYGDAGLELDAGQFSQVTGGNDTLYGGGGNDTLIGDAGTNLLADLQGSQLTCGNDTLFGDAGNDLLIGDAAGDAEFAPAATALVLGNDTLVGGAGNDVLWGDIGPDGAIDEGVTRGDDTFVFGPRNGSNVIGDFEVWDDTRGDFLDVTAFGFASKQAVLDRAQQVGDDTVIDLGSRTTVTLLDVAVGDLDAANILV